MKSKMILAIAIAVLPLALVSTACGHRPADEGTRRLNDLVVLANDKDRGYLGVNIDEVTRKLARQKDLKVDEGVYVSSVEDDSPAEKAGFKRGDVILTYDGTKVYDENDLVSEVRRTKPGTEVTIGIDRFGEKKQLKATIERARQPRVYSFSVPQPPRIRMGPHFSWNNSSVLYGLTVEELDKQLGEYFGAPDGRGVLVKSVKRGSEGEKSGFKAGDVIVKVGKNSVRDTDDMWDELREYKDGDKAEVEILRKGKTEKLSLTIDSERDVSYRWHDGDDDVIIDMLPNGGGVQFRREADKMKRETDKLKRELERMRDRLQDDAIELKEKLQKEVRRIRDGVNV